MGAFVFLWVVFVALYLMGRISWEHAHGIEGPPGWLTISRRTQRPHRIGRHSRATRSLGATVIR